MVKVRVRDLCVNVSHSSVRPMRWFSSAQCVRCGISFHPTSTRSGTYTRLNMSAILKQA